MHSVDIEPNKEEKLEKLAQDFAKPFSPPFDIAEHIPKDYPSLDTNVDEHEWYDAGATVSSVAELLTGNSVLGYKRPLDQMLLRRRKFNKARKKLL